MFTADNLSFLIIITGQKISRYCLGTESASASTDAAEGTDKKSSTIFSSVIVSSSSSFFCSFPNDLETSSDIAAIKKHSTQANTI